MAKEVKKTPRKVFFYLSIISLISKGLNATQICDELNVTKQTLNYYMSSLKQKKYIEKVGYGVWRVLKEYNGEEVKKTPQVTETSLKGREVKKNGEIRSHAFMFTLQIPKIENWLKRYVYLNKKGIKYKTLNNLGKGQKIELDGTNIHLKNKSIIFYESKSYLGKLASESKSDAIMDFFKRINKLENLLDTSFKINKSYKFKVCREHHAIMQNALAKVCNEKKVGIRVKNEYGQWFFIDNSFNLDEAETMKNRDPDDNQAVIDNEGIQNYFNEHKETNFEVTPKFILNGFNQLNQAVLSLTNHISPSTHEIKPNEKLKQTKLTDKPNYIG